MTDPLTLATIMGIVQIVSVLAGAVWVVASVRGKTTELAAAIVNLAASIDKLDRAVERLDVAIRDLDRRVTRLEVNHDHIDKRLSVVNP